MSFFSRSHISQSEEMLQFHLLLWIQILFRIKFMFSFAFPFHRCPIEELIIRLFSDLEHKLFLQFRWLYFSILFLTLLLLTLGLKTLLIELELIIYKGPSSITVFKQNFYLRIFNSLKAEASEIHATEFLLAMSNN